MDYFLVAEVQQVIGDQARGGLVLKDDGRYIGSEGNVIGHHRQLSGNLPKESEVDPKWQIKLDARHLLIAKFVDAILNVLNGHLFDVNYDDAKASIASGLFQSHQYLGRTDFG
jgi:hypothetical protein